MASADRNRRLFFLAALAAVLLSPALAAMRMRTPRGPSIPLFGPSDIRIGRKLAAQAVKLARQRRKQQELAARKRLVEGAQPGPHDGSSR